MRNWKKKTLRVFKIINDQRVCKKMWRFVLQLFRPALPYRWHEKNFCCDIYCVVLFYIPSSFYFIYSTSFCCWVLSSTSFYNQHLILPLSLTNTYRLVFFVTAPKAESTFTHANESSPCQRKMCASYKTCEIRNDTTRLWIADGVGHGHINYFRKWVGRIIKKPVVGRIMSLNW
jgi:hypothetical protein